MAMVQMNTRLDSVLKQSGDAVFARYDLSPSDVVRAVWSYAAAHQRPPEFLIQQESKDAALQVEAEGSARIEAGLAIRVAERECGYVPSPDSFEGGAAWRGERDLMYDEMLEEMEQRCR